MDLKDKLMANIDERLMGNTLAPEQEGEAAGKLKEKKRGSSSAEATEDKGGEEAGAEGEPRSLRQRVQAARQAMDLKERAKQKLKEKVAAPARAVTNRALQWAWKALLPSWGLSSFWINIHVGLKYIFGEKLFCKLGDEWIPPKVAEASGEAGKIVSKSAGLVEVMVLIFIDVIIFFVIVGLVAMFTDKSTFETMTGEANKAQPAAVQQAE